MSRTIRTVYAVKTPLSRAVNTGGKERLGAKSYTVRIPKKRIAVVGNPLILVGTILAMPLITTATKKYLMLKNCGNTIFYAVDPAVYQVFLWVLDYI